MYNSTDWGPTFVTSINVGTQPFGVAFDAATNEVYVTNSGSNNVTVIAASSYRVVASIGVGSQPLGVAYDSHTGNIYVANGGSDNISVIDGVTRRVIGSVSTGAGPLGVAADPSTGQVFVANRWSNNVTVVSDTTNRVVATVNAGSQPYGVALDNASDEVYVTNLDSNNITVISAGTNNLVVTIPVVSPATELQGAAYDSSTGLLWVGGGRSFAVAINTSTHSVQGYSSFDPSGVVFIPDTGDICVTNTDNFSLGCFNWSPPFRTYPLTFDAMGLPVGTEWSVSINGSYGNTSVQFSNSAAITFWPPSTPYHLGSYYFRIPAANGFTPWPSNGSYPADQLPSVVDIIFTPPPGALDVIFSETGLSAGHPWSVTFNGTTGVSSGTTDVFAAANGTYAFSVGPAGAYAPTPSSGRLVVAGQTIEVPITFSYSADSFVVSFRETGLAPGTLWVIVVNGTYHAGGGPSISVGLPRGSFGYTVEPVLGFIGPVPSQGTLTVTSNTTVQIAFFPTFTVTFTESGLPAGVAWEVEFDGFWRTNVSGPIDFARQNGTYPYLVANLSGYSASPASGALGVDGMDLVQSIQFAANPSPLLANFSYQIQYATCLTDGGVTNYVLLSAAAAGGTAPYNFHWTLPTGSATTALTDTTLTHGQNNTVTMLASDSNGHSVMHSAQLPMQLPPCPPPGPIGPEKSTPTGSWPIEEWAIVGLATTLAAVTGVALWLGLRGGRGPPGGPSHPV